MFEKFDTCENEKCEAICISATVTLLAYYGGENPNIENRNYICNKCNKRGTLIVSPETRKTGEHKIIKQTSQAFYNEANTGFPTTWAGWL